MGNNYSADHIAEDHIHKDISNIEEPQKKYRLGTVSNRLLGGGGGGNMFNWIQTLALSFYSGLKHSIRMKVFLPINEST